MAKKPETPKERAARLIAEREQHAEKMLDLWTNRLSLAVSKVRAYQKRRRYYAAQRAKRITADMFAGIK